MTMRLAGLLLIIILGSCSKQEVADRFLPLEEEALSMAAIKCQDPEEMDWLREMIQLAEYDAQYKGSIYAIQYSSGIAFLHQPWISSCFGCRLYNCQGDMLTLNESERIEILAGAKDENLIYSSSN